MNPKDFYLILETIETCIKDRPTSTSDRWVICWHKDEFKCLPWPSRLPEVIIFGRYHTRDLIEGFTAREWSNLSLKIISFFAERNQCPEKSKP